MKLLTISILLSYLTFNGQIANNGLQTKLNGANGDADIVQNLTKEKDTPQINIQVFRQYYSLQKALEKYQAIKKKGGWESIACDKKTVLKYGSASTTVCAVRRRLFAEGYLDVDSQNPVFDQELLSAINQYQNKHNLYTDSTITNLLITSMNIPVKDRINTIGVNLERCRTIEPDSSGNYIAVNIPAFKLYFFRDGKLYLDSKVVVGKEATKTVIFNGVMDQIIFRPYWNIPNSIAQKEVLPAIKKNPNLFPQMRLEWHNGKLRQKPGPSNALGLVKFVFPNSNNIYLHDTPLKAYFKESKRAFSHGCIRVEKACELATAMMQSDYGWTEQQTTVAMSSGKQKAYRLKTKIPVYITYFTAWADDDGTVAFYPDLYGHDAKLAELLSSEKITNR